jgi:hypothetical protein
MSSHILQNVCKFEPKLEWFNIFYLIAKYKTSWDSVQQLSCFMQVNKWSYRIAAINVPLGSACT